jgi:general secretion pathway protein F
MARFSYRAVDATGASQLGVLEAASPADVAASLERRGWTALSVVPRRAWDLAWLRQPLGREKLSASDLLGITQQISALLKAGLTIDRALATVQALTSRARVRPLLGRVLLRIREGATFGDALAQEQGAPEYYISMVRSGEIGGALPDVMSRLEEFLARTHQFRARIQSALIYPAILLLMIAVTFLVVVFVVLPRFERLFAEAGAQLPLPTRIVMGLGHFVSSYGLVLSLSVASVGVLAVHAYRRPAVRLAGHRRLVSSRWTLGLIANIETARFLRTLATLLANGVSLPAAIRVARGTLSNEALRTATDELLKRLREGESLADRLARARLFPQIAIQLARVGEETGRLEPMLTQAAEILERDAQRTLERLLVLLVPAVTILMGLLVAALVASVLVGVLSLNDLAL